MKLTRHICYRKFKLVIYYILTLIINYNIYITIFFNEECTLESYHLGDGYGRFTAKFDHIC